MEKREIVSSFAANQIVFADFSQKQFDANVATEMPVNIVYGGMPYAVMMITPADIEDFVYGFSLTEGIIKTADDIREVSVYRLPRGLKQILVPFLIRQFGMHYRI